MSKFLAIWRDRAAILAKAEDEDSVFDIAEHSPTEREFPTLDAARDFLVKLIGEGRDFFGQAEVARLDDMPRRCRYCTCKGRQVTKRWQVDDSGIVGESCESECLEDDS